MEYLNKLLFHIEKDGSIFKNPEINYVLGLTNTQVKDLKKEAISNGYIQEKEKREFILTPKGKEYLKNNPIKSWCSKDFPKRPEINLEYLKLEKMPPILTKAIRCLARHLLEGEELKQNTIEDYLSRELLAENSSCKDLKDEIEKYILNGEKIKLTELFDKFMAYGITKSIVGILLLSVLAKNKDILAIYEKLQFQLKLNQLMFDRMIFCPQNFEIQKTIMEDLPVLEDLSIVLSKNKTKNILDITKNLICAIRELDKYTMNTERLSKKTTRFRNVIVNAKDPISLFYRDIPKVLTGKLLPECNNNDLLKEYKNSINELRCATENMISEIKEFFLASFQADSREEMKKRFQKIEEFLGEKELRILFNNVIETESDDELWINRIATFINKSRVPKDWSDEDIADFKVKVKDLALNFYSIEATVGTTKKGLNQTLEKIINKILELSKDEQKVIMHQILNN